MTTNMRTAGFVKSHSQSGKGPVIVQVLPALVRGGVERGTIEMARSIINAGGKAVVISSGGPLVRHLDRIDAVHHTLPVGVKNPLAWSSLRRRCSTSRSSACRTPAPCQRRRALARRRWQSCATPTGAAAAAAVATAARRPPLPSRWTRGRGKR